LSIQAWKTAFGLGPKDFLNFKELIPEPQRIAGLQTTAQVYYSLEGMFSQSSVLTSFLNSRMANARFFLVIGFLVPFSTTVVWGAEILFEEGPSRIVGGDWAARMARQISGEPRPTDISDTLIREMISAATLDFLLPHTGSLAQAIRRYGWAQFEQEPEQVPTAQKVRFFVDSATPSVLCLEHPGNTNVVDIRATADIRSGKVQVERFPIVGNEDRTVYASFLSVENMVLYQEHFQRRFFEEMLDLNRPGLERVRDAYRANKKTLAVYELSEYFRNKTTPAALIRKPTATPQSATTETAEAICRHEFNIQGTLYQFGAQIDWSCYHTVPAEWLWSLNNLTHLIVLLNGYLDTSNEKYAAEFVAQITDWIIRNPAPPYTLTRVAAWRNLEAGNRGVNALPITFYGFLCSDAFTPQVIQLMLGSIWSHGDYILKYPAGWRRPSNWSVVDSTGLAAIAVYFPEFRDAEQWKRAGYERLAKQLQMQVYPDGAQWELAPSYHLYCLDRFHRAYDLALETGVPIPGDFGKRLQSMYDYLMWICKPDGTVPAFSDSTSPSVLAVLQQGAERFNRPDFRYVATSGKDGTPPAETSHYLPYAGNAVMRSGWDEEALYLCFDGGPLGTNHQHDDKLSFELSAYGKNFIIDPGPYRYVLNSWRSYAVSTQAHSTVMIDGFGQNRLYFSTEHEAPQNPTPVWQSNDLFDYTMASYDCGYGVDSIPVIHKRHIFFKKNEYWILLDEIVGEGKRRMESLFHFGPEFELKRRDNLSVYTQQETGPNCAVIPANTPGLEVSIIKGRETPSIQGWYLPSEEGRKPAPVACYEFTGNVPAVFAYLLLPYRDSFPSDSRLVLDQDNDGTATLAVHIPPKQVDRIQIDLKNHSAEWPTTSDRD